MSTAQNLQTAYGFTQSFLNVFPAPVPSKRNPTTKDMAQLGTIWLNQSTNGAFILTSFTAGTANWIDITEGGTGTFTALTVTPGPINLTGLTNINTTGAANTNLATGTNTGTVTLGNAANLSFVLNGNAIDGVYMYTNGGQMSIATDLGGGELLTIGNLAPDTSIIQVFAGSPFLGVSFNLLCQPDSVCVFGTNLTTGSITIGDVGMTGDITIGNSTEVGSTINIGSGSGSTTINIGTNAAAVNDIIIGTQNLTSSLTLEAGTGSILLDALDGAVGMTPATTTSATTSATLDSRVGSITFTGTTINMSTSTAFTITNALATATSAIFVTALSLSATGLVSVGNVLPRAGSIVVTLANIGTANTDGSDLIINFWILN